MSCRHPAPGCARAALDPLVWGTEMAPIKIEGGGSRPLGAVWPGHNNQPIGVGIDVRDYVGEKGRPGRNVWGGLLLVVWGEIVDRRKN